MAAVATLSGPAWGVRYEFKMGVFAEFRQEFEVALKCVVHYCARKCSRLQKALSGLLQCFIGSFLIYCSPAASD